MTTLIVTYDVTGLSPSQLDALTRTAVAAGRGGESYPDVPTITTVDRIDVERCTVCMVPAHASETDDLGRHPGCVDR